MFISLYHPLIKQKSLALHHLGKNPATATSTAFTLMYYQKKYNKIYNVQYIAAHKVEHRPVSTQAFSTTFTLHKADINLLSEMEKGTSDLLTSDGQLLIFFRIKITSTSNTV